MAGINLSRNHVTLQCLLSTRNTNASALRPQNYEESTFFHAQKKTKDSCYALKCLLCFSFCVQKDEVTPYFVDKINSFHRQKQFCQPNVIDVLGQHTYFCGMKSRMGSTMIIIVLPYYWKYDVHKRSLVWYLLWVSRLHHVMSRYHIMSRWTWILKKCTHCFEVE